MSLIYQPRGKAREYAPLALELYSGCLHRCRYCYVPGHTGTTAQQFHHPGEIKPINGILDQLEREARSLQLRGEEREILMCFHCDPYQNLAPRAMDITRQAIKILIRHDLHFTILTKGGLRAARDFDLLEGYHQAAFGTTLVFWRQADADVWESGAASIVSRIAAVQKAKSLGVRCWISLEPVIDPEQALMLVKRLHPYVDYWRIGKINDHPELEKRIDWKAFGLEICRLLDGLGARYYLKQSLVF
jgi:DNA repair photolyase